MNLSKVSMSGWLNLYKPAGISSAKAVAIVKRIIKPSKIGHAGTLDPLAEGVLPLAIGEATKTIQFCMNQIKEYEFTVKWTEATTTDDCEGEIIATSDHIPTILEIDLVLPKFIGKIMQAPPIYSAIKVNGVRAYDLARLEKITELPERPVEILDLRRVEPANGEADGGINATFRVACGKGTYVRSLARDIAISLGTYAHVIKLCRTRVGNFSLGSAILLEDIEKSVYKGSFSGLLSVDSVLDDIQVLEFTPHEAIKIRNGQKLQLSLLSLNTQNFLGSLTSSNLDPNLTEDNKENFVADSKNIIVAKSEGKLVAVCHILGGVLVPLRVFNLH